MPHLFGIAKKRVGQKVMEHKNEAMPKEIRKFNVAAFLISWIWALGNGLWLYGLIGIGLFLVPCINTYSLIQALPYEDAGLEIFFLNPLLIALAVFLGFRGNALIWREGRIKDLKKFRRSQLKWTIFGAFFYFLFLYGFFDSFLPSTFLIGHNNGIGACRKELGNLRDAVDQAIASEGIAPSAVTAEKIAQYYFGGADADVAELEQVVSKTCRSNKGNEKGWSFSKSYHWENDEFCFSGYPSFWMSWWRLPAGERKAAPIYVGSTGHCPEYPGQWRKNNWADPGSCPGMNGTQKNCYDENKRIRGETQNALFKT